MAKINLDIIAEVAYSQELNYIDALNQFGLTMDDLTLDDCKELVFLVQEKTIKRK